MRYRGRNIGSAVDTTTSATVGRIAQATKTADGYRSGRPNRPSNSSRTAMATPPNRTSV